MAHDGDRIGIKIHIPLIAQQGGVIGRGEDERLGTLVIGRRHVCSAQSKSLRLTIERHDIGGILLRDHARLQAAP